LARGVVVRGAGWQAANMVLAGDAALRQLALSTLDELVDTNGPRLTRKQLRDCVPGVPTPHLADRQKGIWNPKWLDATLSVLTTHDSKYPDRELGDGVWSYSYREGGTGGDNRKLRFAYELGVDVIHFQPRAGLTYEPIYPVRIVENYPDQERVILVRRDIDRVDWNLGEEEYLRRWVERTVLQRLHQDDFRKRVMRAYEDTCAVCNLKYERLLDAVHIDRDKSEFGEPHTNNGLALCKLHHRAYDLNLMGISPDYVVKVKSEVRRDSDGPMLLHGIQEMHGRKLWVPVEARDKPLPERLDRRYREFKNA